MSARFLFCPRESHRRAIKKVSGERYAMLGNESVNNEAIHSHLITEQHVAHHWANLAENYGI